MIHIVTRADQDLPGPHARAAIVSVVIGEKYTRVWKRLCAGSWFAYAERFGFDVILVTERIDPSDLDRSPAWQKCLILDRPWSQRYERIVWLDSDIVIGAEAPNILEHAGPIEKIALCQDAARVSGAEGQIYIERSAGVTLSANVYRTAWARVQHDRYVTDALPPHEMLFNTGVMTLSPAHHNQLLLEVYPLPQTSGLFEQAHLSHRLLHRDLWHPLSPRFNWGLVEPMQLFVASGLRGGESEQFIGEMTHVMLRAELRKAYFLHFYSAMNLMSTYAAHPAFEEPALAPAA